MGNLRRWSAWVLAVSASAACSVPPDSAVVDAKMSTFDPALPLWKVQPGLGTVMIEYNTRMANVWFAAQAKNWEMVKYQIKEMREIQEVAEITRPPRAEMLRQFETAYLDPLAAAVEAMDPKAFDDQYARTITACNACHQQTGFSYIEVVTPSEPATKNIAWEAR